MKRVLAAIGLGGLTTFTLFVFMASLISSEQVDLPTPEKPVTFTIAQTPPESRVEVRPRIELTPPPMQPPVRAVPEVAEEVAPTDGIGYKPGVLNIKTGMSKTFTINGAPNSDARPVVRINPKYPVAAARDGVEGWVNLSFDINEIGQVVNVKVLDAQPKRIFNKAAKQALRKWKYRAKMVDGKAIVQRNLQVMLSFNMNQET